MPKRAAKFVSAIFASLLASSPLVTVSHSAPAEADKCLTGPKGPTPAGSHWYYRIDRATKRQCWYLGEEKEKVSRAAPETSSPAANPASPPTSARTSSSSIANARAELPSPQSRVDQAPSVFTEQRTPATIAGAISPENDQRANAGDAGAQGSVVATRWPELADLSTPAIPGPSTDSSATSAPANSTAAPTLYNAEPPAAVAALPLVAANTSSTENPSDQVQRLLIAILGALALAGLLASVIFRFGRRRRTAIRIERRVNWDAVRTDRPSLSDEARSVRAMRDLDFPHEPRDANVPNERIEQMLARLARSHAN